jgi:uncharacterized protein YoxC
MIDEILSKLNLKYEDLNVAEKETLNQWLDVLASKKLSIEDVKNYVRQMISSVEQELAKIEHNSKQDLFLKARIRNYILLEGFLESPEKAKKALENMLSRLGEKK